MSAIDRRRWERIEVEFATTLSFASDTHISMVLNEPEEATASVDYHWHSIVTEYLDDSERSELMVGLRDAGFAVTVYNGETAFLKAVLTGEWQKIAFSRKYVFSTTGSGVGRARTSLIPSFCDLQGIPLCSADGLTAALLENKFYTFRILEALGFPVPQSSLYVPGMGWNGARPSDGVKVICKPCRECSSIGIDDRSIFIYESSKTKVIDDLASAFRQPIMVQEFIAGYEVEVPILACPEPVSPAVVGIKIGNRELLGDQILANHNIIQSNYEFYDFTSVEPRIAEQLKSEAEAAYRALCFSGLARVDWRIKPDGTAFITDFNTPPHLTLHSSCNYAFQLADHNHSDLMASLVTAGRINSHR